MTKLSHFDASGQAHMVDIAHKEATKRTAIAIGSISMSAEAFKLLEFNASRKGDVLGIARIAAIQGTKMTATMIPLCHPLSLSHVHVEFYKDESALSVQIEVTAETVGKTGVEMEALTGASAGLLTIYDMLKAVDKRMVIQNVHLVKKQGGKSGDFTFSEKE